MKNKHLVTTVRLVAFVSVLIGFRLVTQSGQDMAMPQNDGYAVSGGLLILLGGIVFGYTIRNQQGKLK